MKFLAITKDEALAADDGKLRFFDVAHPVAVESAEA